MNESELLERYPHLLFARNWDVRGSSQLSNLLGECVAYIRVLREIPLLPEEHKRLLEVSLRRGALATTAIEGNTLTEADLVRIFDQDESPTESMNYQKVEVENIIDAMNIIKDDLLRGSESIIEPELIRELHRLITRNLGEKVDCIPGKFREDNRHVGGIYRAPDYSDVDLLMDRLCRWLRSEFLYPAYVDEYGPIIQAVVAHIYLEWIHPFGDGNGRTGRLLEFYIQVRGGIPVVAATLLSNHYNQTRSEL